MGSVDPSLPSDAMKEKAKKQEQLSGASPGPELQWLAHGPLGRVQIINVTDVKLAFPPSKAFCTKHPWPPGYLKSQ